MTVFTIGHSTRGIDEFVDLLRANGIELVVDVRRYPGSRRYPQFGRAELERSLADAGIAYRHESALGGRRTPARDSRNSAWRSASFRGYADHMGSPEFAAALSRVMDEAVTIPTALMCAEAVPWRCHRQLIADALVAKGVTVRHVIGPGPAVIHVLHPSARVGADLSVSYPAEAPPGFLRSCRGLLASGIVPKLGTWKRV